MFELVIWAFCWFEGKVWRLRSLLDDDVPSIISYGISQPRREGCQHLSRSIDSPCDDMFFLTPIMII